MLRGVSALLAGLIVCAVGLGLCLLPLVPVLAAPDMCIVEPDGSVRTWTGFHAVMPGSQYASLGFGLPLLLVGFANAIYGLRRMTPGLPVPGRRLALREAVRRLRC